MLITLTACLYIDDEFHAARVAELQPNAPASDSGSSPSDSGSPPGTLGPPAVSGVDPPYGTDAGGTLLTVSGGPFASDDPALEVRIGAGVARVVSVEAGAVVVEAPASDVDGLVDLTVATGGGSVVAPSAFTYWPDATGRVGATGELVWFFRVGSSWGPDDEDYGRSTLRFTQPFDYQFYRYWAPALDECFHIQDGVPEYAYEPEYVSLDALGGTATQRSASSTIELGWNAADVRFTEYDLYPQQLTPGETYDLDLVGAPGLPDLHLTDVFDVPSEFVVTNPAIAAGTFPEIDASHHFEWSTEGEGDAILLQVGMLNAAGDAFQEELWCASRDVGSFTLPGTRWNAWTPDRQIHVLIGRYNTGRGLLPWNQGRIEVASQVWYYGIGRSR
jgi:hypothetical protein